MELRPLGFGEIFDRAVTLCIRNFVPFAAIVAVLIVPNALLQYVYNLSSQPAFDAMIKQIQHPGQARAEHVPTIFNSPGLLGIFAAILLVAYVTVPFVQNAVAVGVARLYRGRPVEFRACYETALRRWPQILGLLGIELLVVAGCCVVGFLAGVVIVLATSAIGGGSALAVALGLVIFFVALIVILSLLAPLLVALALAMYAAVIEERAAIASLLLGFSRVFKRNEFWRAFLFFIAATAITLGASMMFSVLGMTAALVHQAWLQTVVQSLPNFAIIPFNAVLFAVYYFDVRVRHEAFDVELSLEHLLAAQPA